MNEDLSQKHLHAETVNYNGSQQHGGGVQTYIMRVALPDLMSGISHERWYAFLGTLTIHPMQLPRQPWPPFSGARSARPHISARDTTLRKMRPLSPDQVDIRRFF